MNTFLVIQDTFYQFADAFATPNTHLGDIFVLDDGLTFVCYRSFHLVGGLEKGLAALFGGLAGSLATSSDVKGELEKASGIRKKDWGLGLGDRLKSHSTSLFFHIKTIEQIQVTEDMLLIHLKEGSVYSFSSKSIGPLRDKLDSFVSGQEVFDEVVYKQYGMATPSPAPCQLIQMIALNQVGSLISSQVFQRIGDDADYVDSFYLCFKEMNPEEKQRVIEITSKAPHNFKSAMIRRLEAGTNTKGCLRVSLFFLAGGLLGLALSLRDPEAGTQVIFFGIMLLIGMGGIPLARWALKDERKFLAALNRNTAAIGGKETPNSGGSASP